MENHNNLSEMMILGQNDDTNNMYALDTPSPLLPRRRTRMYEQNKLSKFEWWLWLLIQKQFFKKNLSAFDFLFATLVSTDNLFILYTKLIN